jgi:serine/threonine protein kinase
VVRVLLDKDDGYQVKEQMMNTVQYIPDRTVSDCLDLYGRYRVLRSLGYGASSEVYLCEDTLTPDRLVAIKCIHAETLPSEEIRALTTVKHRNIPIFHECFIARETWHLVMDYIDGERLSEYRIRYAGRLSCKDVRDIGIQLASALDTAHQHDIIYRDLKPSNILRTRQGHVALVDFGGASEECTNEFYVIPPYAAPEQRLHLPYIGSSVDVYALGVVLHELITGTTQFSGEHFLDAQAEQLRALCQDMAAENRDKRPEMIDVLRELLRM